MTTRTEEDGSSVLAWTGSFSALRRASFSRKERKPATQAGALLEGTSHRTWEVASPISASELLLSLWEEDILKANLRREARENLEREEMCEGNERWELTTYRGMSLGIRFIIYIYFFVDILPRNFECKLRPTHLSFLTSLNAR